MDDENEEPRKTFPPAPATMSKVPSWISVGLVLGIMIGWALKPEPKPAAVEVRMAEPPPRLEPAPTKLTTIEAVFELWAEHAVWEGNTNTTEVAFWNAGTQDFTEFYEVRRLGTALYFRSIQHLTRRIVRHGKPLPAECPLQFTETEEQYRDWRENGRVERPATESYKPQGPAVTTPVPERPPVGSVAVKLDPPEVRVPAEVKPGDGKTEKR